MPSPLPDTYYDYRLKETPFLSECVRQDSRAIEKKNLPGPFFDADSLQGFGRYFERTFTEFVENAQEHFKSAAGRDYQLYRSHLSNFAESEAVEREEYFQTVDYLTMLNFTLYGKKTFFFNDNLIEHLVHTELDVPSEHIRLPFSSCLFVISSEAVIKALQHLPIKPPLSKEPLNIFITETIASEEEQGNRKIVICCYQDIFEKKPLLVKRSLLIREDWSIKKMLQTNWGSIFDEDADKNSFTAENDDEFYKSEGLLLFYRVLLNSILYIQSKDADIISKLSPHRRARQMNWREKQKQLFLPNDPDREISKLDYELVGENVSPLIIQRVVFEEGAGAEEEASENAEARVGERKLAKRILVRGHWRNQAFGENYGTRKLIWIKPFYKGPEMAEMIERSFIVK